MSQLVDQVGNAITSTRIGSGKRAIADGRQALDVWVRGGDLTSNTTNTTRTEYNVTLGPADTEQSQALPANTKGFIIKTRGNAELKFTDKAGMSGTTFTTVKGRAFYSECWFYTGLTLYFQSPTTGDVVEIVAFT